MGIGDRLRTGFRRFMRKPGTTVDLGLLSELLPLIEESGAELTELTDAELTEAADELRAEGPDLDPDTLVRICALGREAGHRALDERAYDVQLLGAMAMLSGHVAEMATGEGKTLAAAIAAFGLSLHGDPVHVLTVNDYLAQRDAEWMEPVYKLLGMSVGWVAELSTPDERRAAYAATVCYASVSEAGFDFLRDGLVTDPADAVQRGLHAVLVDEADSILVDEARIPLVLAGAVPDAEHEVRSPATLVAAMRPGLDYELSDDGRNVQLTDHGLAAAEKELGGIDLYDAEHLGQLTAINLALHARALLKRDVDYIVRDGKVELVDEFRGRVAHRRRWPDGLQAAVEAKEGLAATAEGEVLGTITVQALVRQYPVRCGMTATAVAVGDNLREFYRLEVAVIEPNAPCVREDERDRVYTTREEKEAALVAEVAAAHSKGRPVLIGTLDVAESERLAGVLSEQGIDCVVLNARNDAAEAAVIAEAGGLGSVTVSTQMAGRGTDIRLGGSEEADRDEVAELGGLYVLGCGRHDSRRVDDQLRGRSGRQGDPGGSVFFVSLEDDLVTHYGQDALPPPRLPDEEDGRLIDKAVDHAIGHAQRVVEGINLEIHRNTWRYSGVLEQQREMLATRRAGFLDTGAAAELLEEASPDRYEELRDDIGEEPLAAAARAIVLYHLDRCWAEHLAYLADVREGVHLRSLGRQDPLDEFHRLAIPAFNKLLDTVRERAVETFEEVEITAESWDPTEAGLVRPTATWTYLVHDNPFGTELERFFTAAAKALYGR